jgi:hypothetical protein
VSKKKTKKQVKWGFTESDGYVATASLTNAVIQLLNSPPVQQINFLFNAQIVNGARYREIAKSIQDFYIVVYHDSKLKKAPGSDSGFYSCVDDALYLGFKNLNSMNNKMLTLHECTHAIGDQYGSTSALDFECTGYIASAMFYRHCGNQWPKRLKAVNPQVDSVYLAAANMADAILDKVVNPFNEAQELRLAIQRVYGTTSSMKVRNDGFTHKMRSGEMGLLVNYYASLQGI